MLPHARSYVWTRSRRPALASERSPPQPLAFQKMAFSVAHYMALKRGRRLPDTCITVCDTLISTLVLGRFLFRKGWYRAGPTIPACLMMLSTLHFVAASLERQHITQHSVSGNRRVHPDGDASSRPMLRLHPWCSGSSPALCGPGTGVHLDWPRPWASSTGRPSHTEGDTPDIRIRWCGGHQHTWPAGAGTRVPVMALVYSLYKRPPSFWRAGEFWLSQASDPVPTNPSLPTEEPDASCGSVYACGPAPVVVGTRG